MATINQPFQPATASTAFSRPSVSYDTLLQFVLQRRSLDVALYSLAVTSLILISSTYDSATPLHAFRLATPVWLILSFITGVLPPVILQNALLKPFPTPYLTRASRIRSLALNAATWITIVVYALSAGALAYFYVLLSPPTTKLSLFKPTTLYPWHLNERFVFIVGGNFILGVAFGVRTAYVQSYVIPWPRSQPSIRNSTASIATLRFLDRLPSLATFTVASFGIYFISYLLFSRPLFRLGLFVFKPFVYNFLRSKVWVIRLPAVWKLALLNFTTVLSWSFAETSYAVHAAEPVMITQFAANPTATLIDGIRSKAMRGCHRYFAFTELSEIARNPKLFGRRKAIFADAPASPKNAWNLICRESLIVLGQDYQNLFNRGQPARVAPSLPPPASTSNETRFQQPLKLAQYAPSHPTAQDQLFDLAASGLGSAERTVATQVSKLESTGLIPALTVPLDPVSSILPPMAVDVVKVTATVVSHPSISRTWQRLRLWLPKPVSSAVHSSLETSNKAYAWLVDKSTQARLAMALPQADLDANIIQALCHLTAASFSEDPYGVVQRDIPRILEALLSFEAALDGLEKELNDPSWVNSTEPLRHALGTGLHAIILVFADHLSAFRFPPLTAKRIQELVDRAS